eukprot:scaffold11326_cov101-Isochrysis_galbana.AAC.1
MAKFATARLMGRPPRPMWCRAWRCHRSQGRSPCDLRKLKIVLFLNITWNITRARSAGVQSVPSLAPAPGPVPQRPAPESVAPSGVRSDALDRATHAHTPSLYFLRHRAPVPPGPT